MLKDLILKVLTTRPVITKRNKNWKIFKSKIKNYGIEFLKRLKFNDLKGMWYYVNLNKFLLNYHFVEGRFLKGCSKRVGKFQ